MSIKLPSRFYVDKDSGGGIPPLSGIEDTPLDDVLIEGVQEAMSSQSRRSFDDDPQNSDMFWRSSYVGG